MTLLDLFHRKPLPVVAPVKVVTLSPIVLVEMLYAQASQVHDFNDSHMRTRCGNATWPLWQLPSGDLLLRRINPNWCQACWHGQRCRICARPSGGHDECLSCHQDSLDEDQRIARAS